MLGSPQVQSWVPWGRAPQGRCSLARLTPAFSSSETIMFLHQIFYQGLKARISSWPTLVLGESQPSCPTPTAGPTPGPALGWGHLTLPEGNRVAP